MKALLLIVTVVSLSTGWSQSLQEANRWFDNYEYAKAAEIYKQYSENEQLPTDDFKRYAYAYYITGEYAKCLPLVDSLVQQKNIEPVFIYIQGECNLGLENYDEAKASYIKYQSLDDEYKVENKIASCDYLKTVAQMGYVVNKSIATNTSKADFTGGSFGENKVLYKELGLDSIGTVIESGDMSQSELFLVRPLVVTDDGSLNQIAFPDSIPNFSVPSIAYSNASNKVYFTVMQPVSKVEIDAVPHIYEGEFVDSSNSVVNMKRWQFSGYEDTTACGYATINSAGNKLIFSKIGSRTKGADLYYSNWNNGKWSLPIELENVNSNGNEMFPLFNGDSILSFSSDGQLGFGGLDVYLASWDGNSATNVTHFASPVNSIDDDFNFVYYSADSARYSSNRIGGKGDDDIYFIKFKEPLIEEPVIVKPPTFTETWVDQIIYFDFDKFNLQKDEKIIEELIAYLKKNENKRISVIGHTDARGTEKYNMELGLKRANRVKNELASLGINKEQIDVVSKGKSDPQVDCSGGCSEQNHAKNRFVLIQLMNN